MMLKAAVFAVSPLAMATTISSEPSLKRREVFGVRAMRMGWRYMTCGCGRGGGQWSGLAVEDGEGRSGETREGERIREGWDCLACGVTEWRVGIA